jgi:DNA-binding transcriptional LysR family regulator
MNTDFFLEFVVLAELEKYGEAAEQLLLSESALSRHIKALETALDVRLFDRTSRRVRLNEYGRIFLPYAKQYITLQQQYLQDLEKAKHGKDGVCICTFYYIDDFLLKFHAFDRSTSIISINNSNIHSDKWQELLRQGTCELAFVIEPVDKDNELLLLPFEVDFYIAVLPLSHPLARRKSISLSELSEENFISFKDNSYSDLQLKEICRKSGFEPKIVFNTDTGSAIASWVRDKIGVSVLLKKTLSKMNIHDVAFVDLEPEAKLNIFVCRLKTAELSKGAGKLWQFAAEFWPEGKRKNE